MEGTKNRPFWVIVKKEMADHILSWRFNILLLLILLTTIASLYTAGLSIRDAVPKSNTILPDDLFLKIFTVSNGTLPSFITFVGFLGPLLGIGMGFDAINSERNKGTLIRLLSQPLYRDDIILGKWVGALILLAVFFFAMGILVTGLGILLFGIPPSAEEFLRVLSFLMVTVVYIAFWLTLSILFSILFRQAATSVMAGMAIWLFFTLFYGMIIDLLAGGTPDQNADPQAVLNQIYWYQFLSRLSPSQLFTEATTTLLTPGVRSLGPLTMEQVYGTIPSPLPLTQSLLLIWPHVVGLIALSVLLFAVSFLLFMRQEVRS
ncbi:ABC-type transport system involved in multi-copper enzyme maturation, permease component [[Clostridium] ultunense Esp]|uniref:ABC transporter permease n=1 Tax=Thermicanus aegyptius TaxID=94009 RepID=UPI0002B6FD8C|nr:ABC transporter permease [Thermicanus aegyptius]CCQ94139.1 ABC-type transport system involved in multi-copper enzyme maturation, permease component [[Clostridium] ultunense Esp]